MSRGSGKPSVDPKTGLYKPGFRPHPPSGGVRFDFCTTREWHDAVTAKLTGWGCGSVGELLQEILPFIPDTRPEGTPAAAPPTDPPPYGPEPMEATHDMYAPEQEHIAEPMHHGHATRFNMGEHIHGPNCGFCVSCSAPPATTTTSTATGKRKTKRRRLPTTTPPKSRRQTTWGYIKKTS